MTDIHLWSLSWESSEPEKHLANWLPPEEMAYYNSITHPRRKNEYLLTHGLARKNLGEYFGVRPQECPLQMAPRSKPLLDSTKLPPPFREKNWYVSVTHSQDTIQWALSDVPVGIDCEYTKKRDHLLDIAQTTFSEAEVDFLKTLTPAEQEVAFHKIWCLKEAFYKAANLDLKTVLRDTIFDIQNEKIKIASTRDPNLTSQWQFLLETAKGLTSALAINTQAKIATTNHTINLT